MLDQEPFLDMGTRKVRGWVAISRGDSSALSREARIIAISSQMTTNLREVYHDASGCE